MFDMFIEHCQEVPEGTAVLGDKPDVTIQGNGRTFGYEITEIFQLDHRGQPGVVQHKQHDAIMNIARRTCAARGVGPLYVSVSFAFNCHLPKSTWPLIGNQLADIVIARTPSIKSRSSWINDYSGQWHNALERVEIGRFLHLNHDCWIHEGAGFAQRDAAREIQDAIDSKVPLLSTYLQRCDVCSLVIAAGGIPGVSAIIPDQICIDRVYLSPFASTYFVRIRDPLCVRLNTKPPS